MPPSHDISCSFCGRAKNEVQHLVSGAVEGLFICNGCVTLCLQAMEAKAKKSAAAKNEEPLPKPKAIKAHLDQYVIGQEKAKTDLSVAIYNHYKRRNRTKGQSETKAAGVEIGKSNIMLMGPSGSGKTELARCIAKYLNVPFFVADATRLTQAGYVGDDVESILQGLMQSADNDISRAEWGICFIDEIDKLARKSGRGTSGYRDITGEGVQQALLKLLEGSMVPLPRGMGTRLISADQQRVDMLDTSNILFVCAGSFAGIEETVERRLNKTSKIGFGAGGGKQKMTASDVYLNVTEEDVLEFGFIPEMVGRIPVLTTTLELSVEDMVRILTEPKNALVKQYQALFDMDSVSLCFGEEALKAIAVEAKKRPTGARALRGIVEAILRPLFFEVPSDPTVETVLITEDTVKGGKAVITHRGGAPEVKTQVVAQSA